jgi:hypothetical protein
MVIETRKHSGGYPVSIDGRPVRPKAEYRSAHRAKRTPAEWLARIDELDAMLRRPALCLSPVTYESLSRMR